MAAEQTGHFGEGVFVYSKDAAPITRKVGHPRATPKPGSIRYLPGISFQEARNHRTGLS